MRIVSAQSLNCCSIFILNVMNFHFITTWLSQLYCTFKQKMLKMRKFLLQLNIGNAKSSAWWLMTVYFRGLEVYRKATWGLCSLFERHFLCSTSVQVLSLCLRSLKFLLFRLPVCSCGIMKEEQLLYYCHLTCVSVFLLLPLPVWVAVVPDRLVCG